MASHASRRRRIGVVVAAFGTGLLALLAVSAAVLAGQAEPTAEERALAAAVRERFEVDLRSAGLALSSIDEAGNTRVITLGDGVVAVDGVPVSGLELREAFGADADLVLRVTYLGEAARRALFDDGDAVEAVAAPPPAVPAEPLSGPAPDAGETADQPPAAEQSADAAAQAEASAAAEGTAVAEQPATVEQPPADPAAPAAPDVPAVPAAPAAAPPAPAAPPRANAPERPRNTRGEVLRVGGSVTIERDERVLGDVTVILGSLTVDGEVTGDITVIAGSARFGPEAVVHRDVTVVGGSLRRAPSSTLGGAVTQVGLGGVRGYRDSGGWWQIGLPGGGWFGRGDLYGTLMRLFILALLASGIVLVARGSVERIARRASAEPLKAGVVGVMAQMLSVPLLVVGILVLVISIIGIPLLLLLPFVAMAVGVVLLVGFSGAVLGAGELVRSRMGAPGSAVYASIWAGAALILLPTMAGEAVGMAGGLFRGLGALLALTGFLLEYAAWTAGLGAFLLNRFSPAPLAPPAPGASPSGGLPAAPPPPVPPPAASPVSPPSASPVDTLPAPDAAAPPLVPEPAAPPPVDPVEATPAPDPPVPPPGTGTAEPKRDGS